MEDNKLLRLLHKDPNAGMEQLMNQYTGLVYPNCKSIILGLSLFSVGDGVWWFKSVYSFGSVGKLK